MRQAIVLAVDDKRVREILENAGLAVEVTAADLDDRALEAPLIDTGASVEDTATVLAEAKATDVSGRSPGETVLACAQLLSLGDEILHPAADMEAARRRLLQLSGKTHQVTTAAVLCRDGAVAWRHVAVANLTMRHLEPAFVGRYLADVGKTALSSPGLYSIDGEGIRLFDKIEGDYFTISGVPLLPLLAELRTLKIVDG